MTSAQATKLEAQLSEIETIVRAGGSTYELRTRWINRARKLHGWDGNRAAAEYAKLKP